MTLNFLPINCDIPHLTFQSHLDTVHSNGIVRHVLLPVPWPPVEDSVSVVLFIDDALRVSHRKGSSTCGRLTSQSYSSAHIVHLSTWWLHCPPHRYLHSLHHLEHLTTGHCRLLLRSWTKVPTLTKHFATNQLVRVLNSLHLDRPGGSNWQHPLKIVRSSLTEWASGKFRFQIFNENLLI
jgi:hypothetical protein